MGLPVDDVGDRVNDVELCVLAEARGRGPGAVDALIRGLSPQLLRYAQAMRADDPEGIVNEAFLRMHNRGDLVRFPNIATMRAYLRRSIRNELVDQARRLRTQPSNTPLTELQSPGTPNFESGIDDADFVSRLLDELTPAQRQIIEMRFLEDLTLQETAERTGLPVGNVKTLQHRGIRRLRNLALVVGIVAAGLTLAFVFRQLGPTSLQPISSDPEPPAELDRSSRSETIEDETDERTETNVPVSPTVVEELPQTSSFLSERNDALPARSTIQEAASGSPNQTSTVPSTTDVPTTPEPTTTSTTALVSVTEAAPATTSSSIGRSTTTVLTGGETTCTHYFVGPGGVFAEGSTTSYFVYVPNLAPVDRQITVTVRELSARQTPAGVDGSAQDIIWGGYYSVGSWDGQGQWIETGRVANRVPNSSLAADGDRPVVGPLDRTWDYSIMLDGQPISGPLVTVTIPAGMYESNRIQVTAWRERVTADLRTGVVGVVDEPMESFMFETDETRRLRGEGVICDAKIDIVDNPLVTFVGGS